MQENIRPLPGVFTVNDSGKKVQFAPGNLFWDGKRFDVEENQYDFPLEWDPKHIGHFLWSKDVSKAVAPAYDGRKTQRTDKFFASDGGAIEGYTVLSGEEWNYLFANALAKDSSSLNTITIDGKNCLVLKPDGFTGTVKDSYTAAEWATAEASGLVALPFAGHRYGSNFNSVGTYGFYWSSTPYDSYSAWGAYFNSDHAYTDYYYRNYGQSVRLVSVVKPSNKPDTTNRKTDSNSLVLQPIDLSKASFGDRFLTRSGKKVVLVGKKDNGEFYLVAVENSFGREPMSVCRDGFFRWNLKGKSQYKIPTEKKEKGGLDVVYKGWDDNVAAALKKEYNEHALEKFAKYLNEK